MLKMILVVVVMMVLMMILGDSDVCCACLCSCLLDQMNKDSYISNGDLFQVQKIMVVVVMMMKMMMTTMDVVYICVVAFKIYDMDKDGYISNGELFQVLKMMVGNNLKDTQLQQIVDKTITHADTDGDGKISFEEFCAVSAVVSTLSVRAEMNADAQMLVQ